MTLLDTHSGPFAAPATLSTTSDAAPAWRPATRHLTVPGGRIAYDDTGGAGPLVVALPALGDLRSSYRFVAPRLAAAGCRVVTMDLRGMGGSSVGWDDHSATAIGGDLLALLGALDAGPAVVVGNSVSAGAAVWAAARAPERVRGLVLLGAFVREPKLSGAMRAILKAVLSPPWGRLGWLALYGHEFARKPADFAAQRAALAANLRESGRMGGLRAMFWAPKGAVEAALAEVRAPALVVMGARDPDFADPAREAAEVAAALRGEARVLDGVGHYPQAEAPEEVAEMALRMARGR